MTEHRRLTQFVRQQAITDDVRLSGSDVIDRAVVIKRQLLKSRKENR